MNVCFTTRMQPGIAELTDELEDDDEVTLELELEELDATDDDDELEVVQTTVVATPLLPCAGNVLPLMSAEFT